MKKYCVAIFLPLFFLLAFAHAGVASIAKNNAVASQVSRPADCSGDDLCYPNAELEHAGVSNACQVHPGLQKITDHPGNEATGITGFTLVSLPVVFAGIEVFDNHNLSYNYPSHNFW